MQDHAELRQQNVIGEETGRIKQMSKCRPIIRRIILEAMAHVENIGAVFQCTIDPYKSEL
jgi:hypothetical protein